MSLKNLAEDTLTIVKEGRYEAPGGAIVELYEEIAAAVDGTRVYTPETLADLLGDKDPHRNRDAAKASIPVYQVTAEKTQAAARRLAQDEGAADLVLLNFASARNPGGGFLRGARAQEEDITRCSALYPCLQKAPRYYEANRAQRSMLYTNHMIYSPGVPFFREDNEDLLPASYRTAVITAPAPNAGEALRRDPDAEPAILTTLRRRAGMVLALAAHHEHRTLLLGAWGCGVFRNQPAHVASAFGDWLESSRFRNAFDRVVFAVYGGAGANLHAFEARFAAGLNRVES